MEDELSHHALHSGSSPVSLTANSDRLDDNDDDDQDDDQDDDGGGGGGGEDSGTQFADLIHRLLESPVTKHDAKFAPVFLCLYRMFSSPAHLFAAVTAHFTRLQHADVPQLVRVGEQLRHLQVLAQWTADYPGDFAHPSLKKDVLSFVNRVEKKRAFAFAAQQIVAHLDRPLHDDDAEWGRFQGLDARLQGDASTTSQSNGTSPSQPSSSEELVSSFITTKPTSPDGSSDDGAWRPATATTSTLVPSATRMPSRDDARSEADKLLWSPRTRLSKTQWHRFLDWSDLDIARELTRIDWVLYSSLRPRHLVLHATMPATAKTSSPQVAHVQRMVEHFNRLCGFVSSLILLRDKPKHRARMLAKWMTVAWKIRHMNNYNTLGAIVAGTNNTAIHRLTATWELVPDATRKQYMRLTLLMGTVRSHSAYRMAWDNSFSERIPFLVIYQKDLVAAETANRTWLGPQRDRINWKKFEIMGDVILNIQNSQRQPYQLPVHAELTRLVLETKITEDEEDLAEELYERSLQVEPHGTAETSRKKFSWLRR